jgi:hypothetical protein
MKELLRKQRENCFNAWAKGKSDKFPKHLWNHFYDTIMNADEPDYKEPRNAYSLGIGCLFIGCGIGFIIGYFV